MTSPEVANVLKKYVTAHPLRFHGGPGLQGGKNKRDFIELQKLALSNMDKFRKKYNDMKAKPGEDNYNQQAVRDALAKAGLSKHITDEHRIEGDETMNETMNEATLKDIQNMIKNSKHIKPYPKHIWHTRKLHVWDDYDLHRVKSRFTNPHMTASWSLKKIKTNTYDGVDQLQSIEKAIYGMSQGYKKGKLSKQAMIDLSKEGVPVLSDIAKNLVKGSSNTYTESYKDKFNAAMKKFGINSLDDLKTDADKKKFFNHVDGIHTADHESVKEETLNEKKADFLRLNFANNQTVKKVDRWAYDNLGHANQGFTSMIPDEHGKSIEWEDIDDADGLMKKLKRAGFRFTVDMRESVNESPFSGSQMKKAIGIARKSSGQYTKAYKEIEKIKKGLGDEHIIQNVLKRANEDFREGHDCEHEHPGKSHDVWIKSKEKNEMKDLEPDVEKINAMVKDPHKSKEGNPKDDLLAQWSDADVRPDVKAKGGADMSKVKDKAPISASYESKKYHDTKPGSLQDAVMQMQVDETRGVTVRTKELSALIETYLNKGGVSHNLSPVIAEKKLEEVLPLQAVREFIGTYNKHFLTNYKAEEFIVREG
jgi:hypothetical protein